MTDVFPPRGPSFLKGRGFSIGTDAILLYHFSCRCRGARTVDLGCGSGVIGILLALDSPARSVTAVDFDPEAAEAARANAALNGLGDRFTVVQGDLRECRRLWPAGSFDLAVMNPPYYALSTGKLPVSPAAAAARSEAICTLEDACRAASWSVRWGGRFCVVYKPERLAELLVRLHDAGLEPKRLRFVQPRADQAPNLVLVESVRGGRQGVAVEAPLLLAEADGSPGREAAEMYRRLGSLNAGADKGGT
ncbi:MAG: methyltransferase [Oscillospiraceae bacterium]|nr:methyltransferase [Oscillospiraceae bacterium]